MVWARRFWLRLQALFLRKRSAQRLDDELQFHLEQQIAENLAAGMSPQEARHAAMRTFGNPTFLQEETRDTWGWTWLEQIAQDIRHASRQLGRSPGFTLAVVLSVPVRRMLPFLARDYGKAGMPETRRLSDGTLPLEARRTR